MRLNLHAKTELCLGMVLALGSCAGPGLSDKQRDEVEDIASSVAGDTVNDSDKVRDLENRIANLEGRLDM